MDAFPMCLSTMSGKKIPTTESIGEETLEPHVTWVFVLLLVLLCLMQYCCTSVLVPLYFSFRLLWLHHCGVSTPSGFLRVGRNKVLYVQVQWFQQALIFISCTCVWVRRGDKRWTSVVRRVPYTNRDLKKVSCLSFFFSSLICLFLTPGTNQCQFGTRACSAPAPFRSEISPVQLVLGRMVPSYKREDGTAQLHEILPMIMMMRAKMTA